MAPPADAALATLWEALPAARLVGGAVRDLLVGRPVADLDLATPDPPDAVQAGLARHGIRTVPTGLAHGTVTAVIGGRPFEITTLRRDVATDGRHAAVAWTDNWEADARRRDFTINAMSLERDGTLHDFFGGLDDLRAGRVRFVGDARTRIREDFLRILRFFRFNARYGGGPPDPEATAVIPTEAAGLAILSPERVWSELKRLLLLDNAVATLELMAETGVLEVLLPEQIIHPGGDVLGRLGALLLLDAPPDPVLRLAALAYGDDPAELVARLRLSGHETRVLRGWLDPSTVHPGAPDDDLRRSLAGEAAPILLGRAYLAEAEQGDRADHQGWIALRASLDNTPRPVFPLAGRDVVAAGVPAGPMVGTMLARVRRWWLAGGAQAGREDCLAALRVAVADPAALPPPGSG